MSRLIRGTSSVVALFLLVFASNVEAQVSGPQAVAGEYIVKFRKNTGVASNLRAVGKLGSAVVVKGHLQQSGMMHVKVNSTSARDALANSPDVEFIEPNYILSVNPTEVSGLGVPPEGSDEYRQQSAVDHLVRVTDSWAIQKPYNQGSKITVAVIDTGLDRSHQLFADSGGVWSNAAELSGTDGVDDDGNGYIDDKYGWNFVAGNTNIYDDNDHGTHVAGIILGLGQDVLASPVRESKVKVMALKFLDANGSGSTSNAVSAIYYAVRNGAKVINNSWGGSSYSQALHEAYTYAYNNGVIITSAAGNSNTNNDATPMYPANLDTPNNIAVAASDSYDAKASFSNYGASRVDVAAPGYRILSAAPGTGCISPGCFQLMSGTSMAAPFVAGMAALILREAPQLSPYQVKSIIRSSSDVLAQWSGKVSTGARVNVYSAISDAAAAASTASWSPSYEPDYKASRSPAAEEGAASPAGCGLVKAIMDSSGGGSSGGLGQAADIFLALSLLLLPLVVAIGLRSQSQQSQEESLADRRVHSRYAVAKLAVLQLADQAINVMTDDISMGGLSFSTNVGLTKGQILDVQFADGSEKMQAEVVWCSQQQAYGLRFLDVSDNMKEQISTWTKDHKPTR